MRATRYKIGGLPGPVLTLHPTENLTGPLALCLTSAGPVTTQIYIQRVPEPVRATVIPLHKFILEFSFIPVL